MGAYLDRLNEQYDEIVGGMAAITDRAAEAKRDVNEDEDKQIARDKGRLDELTKAIEHYSGLETQATKVAELRRSIPTTPAVVRTGAPEVEAYDILRDFPTVADYAIAVHRAQVDRNVDAIEALNRATAHQKIADNPGIVPRPVVGGLINTIDSSRPFIESINKNPLPAGKFDRPRVVQHVDIQKQAAEKDLTASQKMTVDLLPVTAATYAGHLNISRQDIKWTSPGILQLVFNDFAFVYAVRTCADACAQFVTSVASSQSVTITAPSDGVKVTKALYSAAALSLTDGEVLPDTMWVSPDVWANLGGMANTGGNPSFPSLSITSPGGNPLGLRLVVDAHFPATTAIVGPARNAEWYEDVDGLMQIQEPDVLGQLVGYAGYAAFLNAAPGTFMRVIGAASSDDDAPAATSSK